MVSAQSARIIHTISMDAPIWLLCVIGGTLGGIEGYLTRPFAMLVGQTSIWDSHYGYGGATRAWPGSRSDCPAVIQSDVHRNHRMRRGCGVVGAIVRQLIYLHDGRKRL